MLADMFLIFEHTTQNATSRLYPRCARPYRLLAGKLLFLNNAHSAAGRCV